MGGRKDPNGREIALLPPRPKAQGNKTLVRLLRRTVDECDSFDACHSFDDEPKSQKNTTKNAKTRVFHRLKWLDPQLGTLGVLPEELVVEICENLIPPEVSGFVFDGEPDQFGENRNNILDFMQASSRLYGIARELKCFRERTYHFAISGLGCSFEGHRDCPEDISEAALEHVKRVKVLVEIDLGQLVEHAYCEILGTACQKVTRSLQQLAGTERRFERYDIEIWITDSTYVAGMPARHPLISPNGSPDPDQRDSLDMDMLLRRMVRHFVGVQNIRVGNIRLLSQPLTYHPRWNCSLPPVTPERAQRAQKYWRRVQMITDAGSYLLSGWNTKELRWCTEFLNMPDFTGYYIRADIMNMLEPKGSKRPPVYDRVVKNRCRCSDSCDHI